jgi:hypothetical protein
MGDFMLHGGEIDERIEPAEVGETDLEGGGDVFVKPGERIAEQALDGVLADTEQFRGGEADGGEALECPRSEQRMGGDIGQPGAEDDGVVARAAAFFYCLREGREYRRHFSGTESMQAAATGGAGGLAQFPRGLGRIDYFIECEQAGSVVRARGFLGETDDGQFEMDEHGPVMALEMEGH